jgi:murein DD-endopeptidase MepM/ murein hydrolase activator NlpD
MFKVTARFVLGAIVGLVAATRSAGAECGTGTTGQPLFSAPVAGPIDVGMGQKLHPLLGLVRLHTGIDYARDAGTPVRASASGLVTFQAYKGEYGRHIEISHGPAWSTSYSHLSRAAVGVGDCIGAGDIIGWIGTTGLSAGPHLHFEIRKGGEPIDPETVLRSSPQ